MWEKFAQNTVTSYVDDKALQIVSGTWTFRENQVFRVILLILESEILQIKSL